MVSLTMMVIPVCLGRCMSALWVTEGHRVFEVTSAATGLPVPGPGQGGYHARHLAQAGWTALGHRFQRVAKLAGKAVVAVTLMSADPSPVR